MSRIDRVNAANNVENVATPEVLYRMKKDTVRPKDGGDDEALRRRFKLEDE